MSISWILDLHFGYAECPCLKEIPLKYLVQDGIISVSYSQIVQEK